MKNVILFTAFFWQSLIGFGQQIDNANFGSVEERIVYNKTHRLEKYEGVLIEYEYRLVELEVKTKEEWFLLCKSYFINLQGLEVYVVNGVNYFSALTLGSRENHEQSYSLPVDLGYKIEFSGRKYHLK
jgi:hypothetical protein